MKVGLSVQTRFPRDRDPALAFAHVVERVRIARDIGMHALHVGDSHASRRQVYLQNLPTAAALSALWGDGPLGLVMILPLWNTWLAAEQIGTLSAIHAGPVTAIAVLGGDEAQARDMGHQWPQDGRAAHFTRQLHTLGDLLGVDVGDPDREREPPIATTCADRLQLWIGGTAPAAVRRAGRLADGLLIAPKVEVADVPGLIGNYRWAAAERSDRPQHVAIRRNVLVTAGARTGPDDARDGTGDGAGDGDAIVGTVDEVAAQLAALAELGCDEVLLRHPVDDQGVVLDSMRRLERVIALLD